MKMRDYGLWTRLLYPDLETKYLKGHIDLELITKNYPNISMFTYLNNGSTDELFIKNEAYEWTRIAGAHEIT